MMKKMRRKLASIISSVGGNELPYFTLTATQDNSSVALTKYGTPIDIPLEYRVNNGVWLPYTYGDSISLNKDDFVQMRNSSDTIYYKLATSSSNYCTFIMIGALDASGNIMSLLDKTLQSVTLDNGAFSNLFMGCTSLQNYYGSLYATTLKSTSVNGIYNGMFYGCSNLINTPRVMIEFATQFCFSQMFYGCSKVIGYHFAFVNGNSTFSQNSSCESLIVDAKTPPTIGQYTIAGLKADCIIYVPAESVDAYKVAQYWSVRAEYIQAIP